MCASFLTPRQITLTYFDLPAKAEAIRLALYLGGIPFEDKRVNGVQWAAIKPSVGPYAQLPFITVDGKNVFQSINILLYTGTLTGLIATELEQELRMREAICACDDILMSFNATFAITNLEERIAARAILFKEGGKTFCQLKRMEEIVDDREFIAGDKLTIADLAVFTNSALLQCGIFDGFPKNCLDCVPKLKNYVNRIASLPKIVEYYSQQNGTWVAGFKPHEDC